MWLQLVKTFYIGQVVLEQAVDAAKKQTETVFEQKEKLKEKVESKVEGFQHQIEELKTEKITSAKVVAKLESGLKENVAVLRNGFKPFDQACDSLVVLLSETAELKETLADKKANKVELASV